MVVDSSPSAPRWERIKGERLALFFPFLILSEFDFLSSLNLSRSLSLSLSLTHTHTHMLLLEDLKELLELYLYLHLLYTLLEKVIANAPVDNFLGHW